jgi:hypothetical protein
MRVYHRSMNDEQRSGGDEKPDQERSPKAQEEEQPIHERSDKVSDYNDPVDDASDDSFPASDPPSFTESTLTREPGKGH